MIVTEKDRRVYYQDLVYHVCHCIDLVNGDAPGHGVCCGTAEKPSTQLKEEMAKLMDRLRAKGERFGLNRFPARMHLALQRIAEYAKAHMEFPCLNRGDDPDESYGCDDCINCQRGNDVDKVCAWILGGMKSEDILEMF